MGGRLRALAPVRPSGGGLWVVGAIALYPAASCGIVHSAWPCKAPGGGGFRPSGGQVPSGVHRRRGDVGALAGVARATSSTGRGRGRRSARSVCAVGRPQRWPGGRGALLWRPWRAVDAGALLAPWGAHWERRACRLSVRRRAEWDCLAARRAAFAARGPDLQGTRHELWRALPPDQVVALRTPHCRGALETLQHRVPPLLGGARPGRRPGRARRGRRLWGSGPGGVGAAPDAGHGCGGRLQGWQRFCMGRIGAVPIITERKCMLELGRWWRPRLCAATAWRRARAMRPGLRAAGLVGLAVLGRRALCAGLAEGGAGDESGEVSLRCFSCQPQLGGSRRLSLHYAQHSKRRC